MIDRRSKPGAQREFAAIADRPTVLYSLASQRLTARALLELLKTPVEAVLQNINVDQPDEVVKRPHKHPDVPP